MTPPVPPTRTRALELIRADTTALDPASVCAEFLDIEIRERLAAAATAQHDSGSGGGSNDIDAPPVTFDSELEECVAERARGYVQPALAREVGACCSASDDLVEWMFGSHIETTAAVDILLELLDMKLLTITSDDDAGNARPLDRASWEAACAHAMHLADANIANNIKWTWCIEISEGKAALFMNVVGIAAHAATVRLGRAPHDESAGGFRRPALRFVALPDREQDIPLAYKGRPQLCRPDVLAFDTDAFHPAPDPNSTAHDPRRLWSVEADCPFRFISRHLPGILNFTSALERNPAIANAVSTFISWFYAQTRHSHLDLSRVCWPEVQLTLVVEPPNHTVPLGRLRVLGCMRQQRCTQEWIRSVCGLVLSPDHCCVVRADALGVEHCTLDINSGHGVSDMVRVALGVVMSTPAERGFYEGFRMENTTSMAPRYMAPVDDEDSAAAPPGFPVQYTHRTVRFITLRGDKIYYTARKTRPHATTFYVHHVMPHGASLVGRGTRVFCVSRELDWTDDEFDPGAQGRQFLGPYILKVYYADRQSECFRYNLVRIARDGGVQHVLLPSWEWRYGDVLRMRGFEKSVVGQHESPAPHTTVPGVQRNREEMFELSDMKRTLLHCEDYFEFVSSFIGFVEGIASLADMKLVHRDLSIGNVLLTRDFTCPATFFSDAAAELHTLGEGSSVFKQRPLCTEISGVLHDMDMAGLLHSATDDLVDCNMSDGLANQTQSRNGTLPYMAPDLLSCGAPHKVEHDLHSLLYVMALFFWSYPGFISDLPDGPTVRDYPYPCSPQPMPWPREVMMWALKPDSSSLTDLGNAKASFFAREKNVRAAIIDNTTNSRWGGKEPRFTKALWQLYDALWPPNTMSRSIPGRRFEAFADPPIVLEALHSVLMLNPNDRL